MDSAAGLARWILICFCLSRCAYACRILEEPRIHFLNAGDSVQNNNPGLKIYCHNATSKYLTHIWKIMTMHLNISSDSYDLYDGNTSHEIYQKYNKNDTSQSWNLNLFDTEKHSQIKINPFENTCIGIYVDSPNESGYIITLETAFDINVWSLIMMVMGIVVFRCAKILSQISLFNYACGIIFLYLINILSDIKYMAVKLIPRRRDRYLLAAPMSFFIIHMLEWELIVMEYGEWAMYVLLVTSLISFICNRFGLMRVTNAKKIQRILQLVGLALICYSIHFYKASFLCCVVLVFYSRLLPKVGTSWRKYAFHRAQIGNK